MKTGRRRLVLSLALLFLLNIFIITAAQRAEAAVWREGSTGQTVRTIQTKLKNWGYYNGAVDGIFGWRTTQAVKWFQSKNGLKADGIVGEKTLAALGMSGTSGEAPPSPTTSSCWQNSSRRRRGENRMPDRSPSGRSY
jgi:N-acetylmuramoyl-L-alanine amidase